MAIDSSNLRYTLHTALQAHSRGDLKLAERLYSVVIKSQPTCSLALGWLGTIKAQLGEYSEARSLLARSIRIEALPHFLTNYGNVLSALDCPTEALAIYQHSLGIRKDVATLVGVANCQIKLSMASEALASAEEALDIDHNNAGAWIARGSALLLLGELDSALESHERATQLSPLDSTAWGCLGNSLKASRNLKRSHECYSRAISLTPSRPEHWSNRGNVSQAAQEYELALQDYKTSIKLSPHFLIGWVNLGKTFLHLGRYSEAVEAYEHALNLERDCPWVLGELLQAKLKICDWRGFEETVAYLCHGVLASKRLVDPLTIMAVADDPFLQKMAAQIYAQSTLEPQRSTLNRREQERGTRIRLAYFSMDFAEHPVGRLIVNLIENHDRDQFDVYAFSYGKKTNDALRKRLELAFEHFIEVSESTDDEIVEIARNLDIDIAIDLAGFTRNSRPNLFNQRLATTQINYLGYPGTTCISNMDYILVDKALVHEDEKLFYSERTLYLPQCYQVNDSRRPLPLSRSKNCSDFGIPKDKFVFCYFGGIWKITPKIFTLWMGILSKCSNSVLWLISDNKDCECNLSREAVKMGVDRSKIIFSPFTDQSSHVERYGYADLFLDTFPYGSHTTASDSLWCGVPILTIRGESFASRVAASLLTEMGLHELITSSEKEYEETAVLLYENQDVINDIKRKISFSRLESNLFKTEGFCKNLEEIYKSISYRRRE